MSDTYAVVDKSKKRIKVSSQLPLDPDPLADLYSVVDNNSNSKPDSTVLVKDTYVQNEALDYNNTAAYITDESAALYDSVEENKKVKTCIVVCFPVLIIAVIAAAVAVAMAFVLITGLHSDLAAALKERSGESENEQLVLRNMESQLNLLNIDILNFSATVFIQVRHLNNNTSRGVEDFDQQINSSLELLSELQDNVNLLTSSITTLERNFSVQLIKISNGTMLQLQRIYDTAIVEEINNNYKTAHSSLNTLTVDLASGIRILHMFDSCEEVSNFSISLPSGMYNIGYGSSTMKKYCFTSCNSVRGNWRRIAFLSSNTSPVECPTGFELINDPNVPAVCKRNPTGARCSSITYSTNGNSYSQVCGTIHGSYFGDPDGFDSHSSIRSRSAGTLINGSYVDGISLTHGSMNKHHIWTLSAIVNFATNPTDNCSVCASNKPSYVGMDYSCDVVERCKSGCSPRQIWGSGQCTGSNTFYKNLMQPTTDAIEMSVCTDQVEGDEDIFLSFVELYVM